MNGVCDNLAFVFDERDVSTRQILRGDSKAGFRLALSRLINELSVMRGDELVSCLNDARIRLHEVSPFSSEPVDCVIWVPVDAVTANDYNPNSVAPPEMELLRTSIREDGYTQPIVGMRIGEKIEVIDGFHRHRVGRECKDIRDRIDGYLPVVRIKAEREDRADRMASTIRHNRARGKHRVEAMSDIVVELKRRNWSEERISKALGMDRDEILRLCQITGLAELFSDSDFSKSWDVEGEVTEEDFKELTDDVTQYEPEALAGRTVNTSDDNRIFHTHDKWECFKAGFYAGSFPGLSKQECEERYRAFLADGQAFRAALDGVLSEWKHSCEHYLTNAAMNRVAWLGQAAACYALGLPSVYRGGFFLLTQEEQNVANQIALDALNKWLVANGREAVTMDVAYSGRQSDIY